MLRKSKQIKKTKMEIEQKAVQIAKQNQPKAKVKPKIPEKQKEVLKSTNAQYRSYLHLTKKIIKLDYNLVDQAFLSLKRFNDREDKVYLIIQLSKCPSVDEASSIQIPLKHNLGNRKIGFIVKGEEFKQFLMKTELYKQYDCQFLSLTAYLDKAQAKLISSMDLILTQYDLHNKIVSKQYSRKVYPFHVKNVPFEFKKDYKIQNYEEYLRFLINSSFTMIINQPKQQIGIGNLRMTSQQLKDNIELGLYEFRKHHRQYLFKDKQFNRIINIRKRQMIQNLYPQDDFESLVGISAFLNHGQQFSCLVKHKFNDFIVREIDLEGNVVHIKDQKLWKDFDTVKQEHKNYMEQDKKQEKLNPFKEFVFDDSLIQLSDDILGKEQTIELIGLIERLKVNPNSHKFEIKVPLPAEKEQRIKIHQFIKDKFPFLESLTKNASNSKVKLTKEQMKDVKLADKLGQEVFKEHILIKIHTANFKKFMANQFQNEDKQQKKAFVKFTLMKRNLDTLNAGYLIAKFLNISNRHFGTAGIKDKRGVTTQYATLQGIAIEQLVELMARKNWNSNILLTDFEYVDKGLSLGDLQGNKFNVVLRLTQLLNDDQDWEFFKNVNPLKEKGFINYFGLQRFGSSHQIKTHEIGKYVILGDWKQVIYKILISALGNQELVQIAFDTGNFNQLLNDLPVKLRVEKLLIQSLIKNGVSNYLTAIQSLPRNAREIYGHAYQSYIWNKLASRRIERFGNEIIVGDLVSVDLEEDLAVEEQIEDLVEEEDNQKQQKEKQLQLILITADNIAHYKLSQVVLPIYGNKVIIPEQSIAYKLVQEVLVEENVTFGDFEETGNKFFIEGNYRYLITVPEKVDYQMIKYQDKNSDLTDAFGNVTSKPGVYKALLLEFNLRKSSYATMLIRELTKCPSSLDYQQKINEIYQSL